MPQASCTQYTTVYDKYMAEVARGKKRGGDDKDDHVGKRKKKDSPRNKKLKQCPKFVHLREAHKFVNAA